MWSVQNDSYLKLEKNKKLKNSIEIKDPNQTSLNTNPHGDKWTTARFVVPFISLHAKNSKTEHIPKFKMHTQYKKLWIIKQIDIFYGGCTPHIIQVCKMMFGPAKKRKIVNPKIQKINKRIKIGLK